jgi:predicted ATP-binding protein involved in virulence/Flp pilus assembly protein TadD
VILAPGFIRLFWASPTYDRLLVVYSGGHFRPEENIEAQFEGKETGSADQEIKPEDIRLEAELQELLKLDEKNLNVARKLINIQRQMNKYEEAARVYDTLISLDPNNVNLIKEKAFIYQEMGDQPRYVKTLQQADRIIAQTSFKENLGKEIFLQEMEVQDLDFFSNFKWEFKPSINVLLGKNGYGKSHLLRALVAMLQAEEEIISGFFENSDRNAMVRVNIEKDEIMESTLRTRLVFDKSFGKVPVLAIPDMRYIDKSDDSIGPTKDKITDLQSQSAWHFMREESYDGLIMKFLYDLCLDYLDHKSLELPIFHLVEDTVRKLTDNTFKFHKIIRKDSARFEIQVLTEGNEKHPLPLQKASQGTLSVIAMFGIIYKFLNAIYEDIPDSEITQQNAIVVIDEIDAHLHPIWQQKILQLFRDTFPNVQFILTSHSPLVIAGCKEREVAVLRKATDGFTVDILDEHFIGATSEDMYRRIFDVEEKDNTYLRLSTLYSKKSEIEDAITKFPDRDKLNDEQLEKLSVLQDQLYYLREFEEVRNEKLKDEQLENHNKMLEMETMQLNGEISELKKQLTKYQKEWPERKTVIPEALLRDILNDYPEQTSPIEAIAKFLAESGRNFESVAFLEALTQLQPTNITYLKDLATQYQVLEEYDKATMFLKKALRVAPEDEDLHLVLKRLEKITGN